MAITLEELREYQRSLEQGLGDLNDPSTFQVVVDRGVELLGLQLKDLADAFAISPSTATRWRQGSTVPHPAMRRVAYRWFKGRADHLARRLETRRPESRRPLVGGRLAEDHFPVRQVGALQRASGDQPGGRPRADAPSPRREDEGGYL